MAITDFYLKQGDSAESIQADCEYDDGTMIEEDLTDAVVTFRMMTASGTPLMSGPGAVVAPPPDWDEETMGRWRRVGYAWRINGADTGTTSTPSAPHAGEFHVKLASGQEMTFPNSGYIRVHIDPRVTTAPL